MCILYLNNLIFARVCDIAHLLQTCMSDCLLMINTVIYCDTVSSNTLEYFIYYKLVWIYIWILPSTTSKHFGGSSFSQFLAFKWWYIWICCCGFKDKDWNTDTPMKLKACCTAVNIFSSPHRWLPFRDKTSGLCCSYTHYTRWFAVLYYRWLFLNISLNTFSCWRTFILSILWSCCNLKDPVSIRPTCLRWHHPFLPLTVIMAVTFCLPETGLCGWIPSPRAPGVQWEQSFNSGVFVWVLWCTGSSAVC